MASGYPSTYWPMSCLASTWQKACTYWLISCLASKTRWTLYLKSLTNFSKRSLKFKLSNTSTTSSTIKLLILLHSLPVYVISLVKVYTLHTSTCWCEFLNVWPKQTYEMNCSHRHCIHMAFLWCELLNVWSSYPYELRCSHRHRIYMAFHWSEFLNEWSSHTSELRCSHRHRIYMAFVWCEFLNVWSNCP